MDEGISYLLEQLQPLGAVSARRMFGGHGIFCDGLMFALIADEQLYFKVDSHNTGNYEQRDLPPFRYQRRHQWVELSYRLAPEELIDEADELILWAADAVAAARRARGV